MSSIRAQRIWHTARPAWRWAPLGWAAALLVGCGGGDGDSTPPPAAGAYTIGGTVAGLGAGKALTLQNLGGDDLAVTANGSFAFATRLDRGVAYAVTVKAQPAGQRCTVAQGTGNATADVSDVQVRCENLPAATFTVGGTVTGLAGSGLVLQNNGRDDLAVVANGGFTFGAPQAGGTPYAVTVKTQPSGQGCTVADGTGTVGSAHVTTVQVRCATAAAALPEGDWLQEQCVQLRAGVGARSLWRITRQSDTRATVAATFATYGNTSCTGAFTLLGAPTDLGSFVFDRTGSTGTLNAFWGVWNQPNARSDRVVWARKSGRLCAMADQTPTIFPGAADVESYVNLLIPSQSCYAQN
jgi:hypothetical protein